jgi:hypothetical protein
MDVIAFFLVLLVILVGVAIAVRAKLIDWREPEPPFPEPEPRSRRESAPLDLCLPEFRGFRLADFHNNAHTMRDFGDLLTVAMLAGEDWIKVPSKPQGGHGIDVLVVREVEGGYKARAIEVKVNNAPYNPATMSDDRLRAALGHLFDVGAFDDCTFDGLVNGLEQGPPFFHKELWRHNLHTGQTTVWDLDEDGEKTDSRSRSSAVLMDALFQVLKQFDRHADYVDRTGVDAPIAEAAVLASTRRAKPVKRSFFGVYGRAFASKPKRRA